MFDAPDLPTVLRAHQLREVEGAVVLVRLRLLGIVEVHRGEIRHRAGAVALDPHAVVGDDVMRHEVARDALFHHPDDLGSSDLDVLDDALPPVLGGVVEHRVVAEDALEERPVLRVHARGEVVEELGDVQPIPEASHLRAQLVGLAQRPLPCSLH